MNIKQQIQIIYEKALNKLWIELDVHYNDSKYYYFLIDSYLKDDIISELNEILDFYEYKFLTFLDESGIDRTTFEIDSDYIEDVMTNFIGKNNNPTSYVSFEITSYEITKFFQNLTTSNLANIVGDFKCGSYLGAVQALYLYFVSNPQRYILTNNAKNILVESLSSGELSSLTHDEFNFIHARNEFSIDTLLDNLHTSESPYNSYLDSLIENYLLANL